MSISDVMRTALQRAGKHVGLAECTPEILNQDLEVECVGR
jgi:hypothetical protein